MSLSIDEIPVLEEENGMQLIKVEIFDIHASSTILKVFPATTTSFVCDAIANKIDLSLDQSKYYNLILTLTWINDNDSQKYSYIRTLKPSEHVLSVFQAILIKQQEKCPNISTSPSRKVKRQHHLNSNNNSVNGNGTINITTPFNYQKYNVTARWFFKDMRSTPLDETTLHDDISANSSCSDDEEDISSNDFSYLNQFERKGYLLRRSRKDPNVWRKRYCILVDNLWCIDYPEPSSSSSSGITRRKQPKAICLKISRHFRVYDSVQGFDYPHCIALQLQSTGSSQNIIFLRASSSAEQQVWVSEIQKRLMINSENQAISMAEMIMSDEVSAQSDKLTKDIMPHVNDMFILPDQLSSSASSSTSSTSSSVSSYSDESSSIINLRVHPASTCSLLHSFHEHHPIIHDLMSFLADANRYKQLHRLELSPDPRSLWVKILIIYQKYLAQQVVTVTSSSTSPSAASYEKISTYWLQEHMTMMQQQRFLSAVKCNYISSSSPTNSSKSHSNAFISSSRSTSPKNSGKTPNNIIISSSTSSSSSSSSSTSPVKAVGWQLSSSALMTLHKRIFATIRRQIAGFDVTSMKMIPSAPDDHDDDTASSSSSSSSSSSKSNHDSTKHHTSMKEKEEIISTPISQQAGVLGWLFGPMITAATTSPTPSSSEQKAVRRTSRGNMIGAGMSDQYIRYEEIFQQPLLSPPSSSNSRTMNGNTNASAPVAVGVNKPLYQIKDIDELPPATLFDEVVAEAKILLQSYFQPPPSSTTPPSQPVPSSSESEQCQLHVASSLLIKPSQPSSTS